MLAVSATTEIKYAKNFRDNIFLSLKKTFTQENIFYKKISKQWALSTIIPLKNWRLFVYYYEDKELKIRFIEKIRFNKK